MFYVTHFCDYLCNFYLNVPKKYFVKILLSGLLLYNTFVKSLTLTGIEEGSPMCAAINDN